MKKERNARKELLDLYLYMDMKNSYYYENATEAMKKRYEEIKTKYDSIYSNRQFSPWEWNEYYGLFYVDGGRKSGCVAIDPKRMNFKLDHPFTKHQMEVMNNRKTTYFHPLKKKYLDYYVNNFVNVTKELKSEFKNVYIPIIKQTLENINNKKKKYGPGDVDLFMSGIYEYDEACMSANMATIRQNNAINNEINEMYITLLTNFFHNMASRIEAASVLIYSKMNPKMKRWSRDKLYDNINENDYSSRDLPSFKYHDKLYLIWNFIKHNNSDTYESLKKDYPDVLYDEEYVAGTPAKYYVKLNEKLINELLNGVEKYFIEWCELNRNENYNEAQWNYEEYFKNLVYDEIGLLRNSLGLEF